MHTPHHCTPVPDITNDCIHGFLERNRLRQAYEQAYYELTGSHPGGDYKPGQGVRLMVTPEARDRALDRRLQPPQILWGVYANTVNQGVQHIMSMWPSNTRLQRHEIVRVRKRRTRK